MKTYKITLKEANKVIKDLEFTIKILKPNIDLPLFNYRESLFEANNYISYLNARIRKLKMLL